MIETRQREGYAYLEQFTSLWYKTGGGAGRTSVVLPAGAQLHLVVQFWL